ncbi:MAG: sulfotransferase [Gemmatimonadota bacterium]
MLEEEKGNLPSARSSVERKRQLIPPPIFIIGTGRSGTSLLRAMLNAHPRIYLIQEAMFLPLTGWLPPWVSGDRRLGFYFRSLVFAWMGLDPAAIRQRFPAPLPAHRLPEVYLHLMDEMARRHGKPRGGDKTPLNAAFLAPLVAAFPAAPVIEIVRDPRAVVWSHRQMPWATSSLLALGLMLRRHERLVSRWEGCVLRIRLEDLVAEPRATMATVLKHIGEPWDEAVIDPARVAQTDPGQPYPWLQVRPLRSGPAGGPARAATGAGWREQMPPVWIRLIERWTGRTMRRFGYPAARLAVEPTRREMAQAIARDLPEAARAVSRRARVARRVTRRQALSTAELQRISFNLNPAGWAANPDWTLPPPPRRKT